MLIARGTYRSMSKARCVARYGEEITACIHVKSLSQNPAGFADLDITPMGMPISGSQRLEQTTGE